MRSKSQSAIPLLLLVLGTLNFRFGISAEGLGVKEMTTLGGVRESPVENSLDIDQLARFAVEEHNKKENALLEFARVVKAKEQVVAGTLHHLTLEVIDAGKKKLYEAKVWVKPWMDFKQLQEFKPVGDSSVTPADLGVKQDDHGGSWQTIPAHDPVIQDAANHAIKTIQQRSNSLAPYELLEIIHSRAQVIEGAAKFDLLLKAKRGSKEEKFKVEVHKNSEGTFRLNDIAAA
ncbi:cysteine proteinase inhibitor 6-like [Aristolochia californica]|uniref:cysteine proteinase inhibitor 6-like n=1 Tax=Aristolochia californica TaxID=171875 RepID=UPI0035D6AB1C